MILVQPFLLRLSKNYYNCTKLYINRLLIVETLTTVLLFAESQIPSFLLKLILSKALLLGVFITQTSAHIHYQFSISVYLFSHSKSMQSQFSSSVHYYLYTFACFDVTNDKADVELKNRHIQTEEVETVEQGVCIS